MMCCGCCEMRRGEVFDGGDALVGPATKLYFRDSGSEAHLCDNNEHVTMYEAALQAQSACCPMLSTTMPQNEESNKPAALVHDISGVWKGTGPRGRQEYEHVYAMDSCYIREGARRGNRA